MSTKWVPVKQIMMHLYQRTLDSCFFQHEAQGRENSHRRSLRTEALILGCISEQPLEPLKIHTCPVPLPLGFWFNRSSRGSGHLCFYKVPQVTLMFSQAFNHSSRRPRTYNFHLYSYFVLENLCASSKYPAYCTWSWHLEQTSGEASRPLSAPGAARTWWVIEIPTHFLMRLGSLPIAQGKWV